MSIENRIERILKRSGHEYDVKSVLTMIENKQIYAFEFQSTLILIEVQTFPAKKVLHVWGMEGDGTLLQLPAIVQWVKELAVALGCDELRCQGRTGWVRALRSHGARPLYTTMVLELS